MRDDFPDDFNDPQPNPLADQIAAWLRARAGKLTSSNLCRARSFTKKGEPTADRIKYMQELCAERMTGDSVRHFVNDAMQWGLDHEDDARAVYEIRTGEIVETHQYRFFDHPRIENCGASIDGMIGSDGLIEIKCPTTPRYVAWRQAKVVPEEHRDQIILELASTGRRWCDFVAYDPRVKDPALRMMIVRYEPTAEEFAAVEADAIRFLEELDALFLAVTHG